jgi:pyrroline-5-carboxylate reductase
MNIGFIGAGKMATALVRGVITAGGFQGRHISVFDLNTSATTSLQKELGVSVARSGADCLAASDVVFICVKPGDAAAALDGCEDALVGKLVVSIMAGVSVDALSELCGVGARVIRAMPNTAAVVGASATVYCAGAGVSEDDLALVQRIFESVGMSVAVPEKWINAVTGLSGSGPAYMFLMIEALAEGGVHAGLPRAFALQLATQTVFGAGKLAVESGEHPAILREAVTSPGGTTAAGLAVLEAAAMRSAVAEAVMAAADRADEMGR